MAGLRPRVSARAIEGHRAGSSARSRRSGAGVARRGLPCFALSSFDLATTYSCLAPDGGAATIDVSPDSWRFIDERADLDEGPLLAVCTSHADWPHGEMHPHEEETSSCSPGG